MMTDICKQIKGNRYKHSERIIQENIESYINMRFYLSNSEFILGYKTVYQLKQQGKSGHLQVCNTRVAPSAQDISAQSKGTHPHII